MIDADAYSAEMRNRQDAAVEWRKEAAARCEADEEELANQAIATFCEAKLTLDKIPTIDAVPVVRCRDCIFYPSGDDKGEDMGLGLEWPDKYANPCPCKCDDGWYSFKPKSDFFCGYGRGKCYETD